MRIYEHKITRTLFLSFLLIFIDQISKYIIRAQGGFYICNTGLAFGLKLTHLVVIIIIIAFILSIISAGNNKSQITNIKQISNSNNQNPKRFAICDFGDCNLFGIWCLKFGILLIIAGGLSNITDRIIHGCVTDFIDLKFWPVFNLADIYITIGAIIIIKHIAYNMEHKIK